MAWAKWIRRTMKAVTCTSSHKSVLQRSKFITEDCEGWWLCGGRSSVVRVSGVAKLGHTGAHVW